MRTMKIEKYIAMNSTQLEAEIVKENNKIRRAQTTIALLERLKEAVTCTAQGKEVSNE